MFTLSSHENQQQIFITENCPRVPHARRSVSPFSDVRALCHHIATEPGQLSFNKGDALRVLGRADADWLLCSLGSVRGLVPIVYVTLGSMEDSQDAAGLGQR